jgi:tight adherence protein B
LREASAIERCPAHLEVALTVIRACAAHGGPAAEPLSRAAATLRGRAADAAERRTQSAQARMSAIVMTVLPVCMLGLLLVTSGSVRTFAAGPLGLAVIATGTAANALGWLWMRRLIGGGQQ